MLDLAQERWTVASSQHSPLAPTPPPEATQSGADSANDELSFGPPKLLAGQDEVVLSSLPTLPSASDSSGKPLTPESDTEDDEAFPRVPSSNTPSPLKLPPEQTDRAARALHESISNLLGKRNAGAMLIEEAEVPPRRKRARPRSKVSQQTPSFPIPSYFSLTITCLRCSNLSFFLQPHPFLQAGTAGVSAGAGVSGIHLPTADIYTSYAFGDEPDHGTSNLNTMSDGGTSSSLQAVYEDPTQAAERRKLISLLNGAPGQSKMRQGRAHRAAAATSSNVASAGRLAGF